MQITQSLVKSLEQECPRKVYEDFTNPKPAYPGSPMDKGSYFETMCLGSGARGVVTTSLPLLNSGKKSADQIRIERQAQRFLNMFNPSHVEFCGKTIAEKQIKITHGRNEGTIDFITSPTIMYDLKLTENLDGYWDDTSSIDFLQQTYYEWLFFKDRGFYPENRLLIFEYGPKERIKEIKINNSDEAIERMLERISHTTNLVDEWSVLDEWPREPQLSSCSKCPLSCSKRLIKESIIFEEVNL